MTNFLSSQTRQSFFMNNRHGCCNKCTYMYVITGMDYHIQQVPKHCRVCGQRLRMRIHKQTASYDCKTFTDNLQIAFSINTSTDDISIHPERFCICCKHSMQRTIHALTEGVHAVIPFQWQKHTDEECTVHIQNKELLACMTS